MGLSPWLSSCLSFYIYWCIRWPLASGRKVVFNYGKKLFYPSRKENESHFTCLTCPKRVFLLYPYLCNRMLKRLGISFCLLLAFAMLQSHNFIPHHHESEPMEAAHHHDHDSDDDKDHNSPFTDLTHNADFGKVIAKPHFIKQIIEKPVFAEGLFFQLYTKLASSEISPRPHPPDGESPLHLIFLSHSVPLRAPPASSCLS